MRDSAEAVRFAKAEQLSLLSHPKLNDAWLCERIVEDPSVLGLGAMQLADEGRLRMVLFYLSHWERSIRPCELGEGLGRRHIFQLYG